MKHRRLSIDFSRALPHWCDKEPEFSQRQNAASTVLPHLEPYLNKVIMAASNELDSDRDKVLINEIKAFILQEANHYQQHRKYNDTLYVNGYRGIQQFEERLSKDYEHFVNKKSLKFNLAYAEGFESTGIIVAEYMFRHSERWLNKADPTVKTLWLWHLAEEFEHRTVCHDVYKRLYGGYGYRIYGLLYAVWHLYSYGSSVGKYLIEQDRKVGRIQDDWRSRWRALRFAFHHGGYLAIKSLRILSPWYDPGRYKMPFQAKQLLLEIDSKNSAISTSET